MDVPIVLEEMFYEFMVIPIPISDKNEMPDLPPHTIVVNTKDQQFINEPTLRDINETLAIAQNKDIGKLTISTKCSIIGLVTAKAVCKTQKLPPQYDVWVNTPIHNQWVYYSTERKELKCTTYSKTIQSKVGVITIAPDCVIDTPTRRILPNGERTTVQRHGFHMNFEADNETNIREPEIHVQQVPLVASDRTARIHDDELEEVLKDAVSASQEFSSTQWIILAIAAMVTTAVMLTTGTWVFLIFHQRRNQDTETPVEETIPLEEIKPNTVHSSTPTNPRDSKPKTKPRKGG